MTTLRGLIKTIGKLMCPDYVDECKQDVFHELEIQGYKRREFCDQVRLKSQCNATDKEICDARNTHDPGNPGKRTRNSSNCVTVTRLICWSNTNEIDWKYCYGIVLSE